MSIICRHEQIERIFGAFSLQIKQVMRKIVSKTGIAPNLIYIFATERRDKKLLHDKPMTEKSRMYSYFHTLFTLADFVVLRTFTSYWSLVKNAITEYLLLFLFRFCLQVVLIRIFLPVVNFFH